MQPTTEIKGILCDKFRCFEDLTELNLRNISIITGWNNTGKSNVSKILKILKLVLSNYSTKDYDYCGRFNLSELHYVDFTKIDIGGFSKNICQFSNQSDSFQIGFITSFPFIGDTVKVKFIIVRNTENNENITTDNAHLSNVIIENEEGELLVKINIDKKCSSIDYVNLDFFEGKYASWIENISTEDFLNDFEISTKFSNNNVVCNQIEFDDYKFSGSAILEKDNLVIQDYDETAEDQIPAVNYLLPGLIRKNGNNLNLLKNIFNREQYLLTNIDIHHSNFNELIVSQAKELKEKIEFYSQLYNKLPEHNLSDLKQATDKISKLSAQAQEDLLKSIAETEAQIIEEINENQFLGSDEILKEKLDILFQKIFEIDAYTETMFTYDKASPNYLSSFYEQLFSRNIKDKRHLGKHSRMSFLGTIPYSLYHYKNSIEQNFIQEKGNIPLSKMEIILAILTQSLNTVFERTKSKLDNLQIIPTIRSDYSINSSIGSNTFLINVIRKIQESGNDFNFKVLNQIISSFGLGERIEIKNDEDLNIPKVYVIKNGMPFLLKDMGLGTVQTIPILLSLINLIGNNTILDGANSSGTKTILIEEPEANLHPNLQGEIAKLICMLARKTGTRFIIETHSEYFIRRIQRLVAEYYNYEKEQEHYTVPQEFINIHYFHPVFNIPEGEKQVYEILIGKDGFLSKPFGNGFLDESSKEVRLLHELKIKDN